MLDWFLYRLGPKLPDLTTLEVGGLPDPHPADDRLERAKAALDAFEHGSFEPQGDDSPFRLLTGMGLRNLLTSEADMNPDTAGRTPTYAGYGDFQPVEIKVDDELSLTGMRSTGAPGAPVILVVHGLFDSHTSSYVVEHAEILRRWGFHVIALDMRDHGRLRGRSTTSLGLFEGKDLFAAARTLAHAEGVSVGILGLSYGGHCAVRAAHEASIAGEPEVLRGGVFSVSAPLNIHEAVAALDDPDSRLPRGKGFKDRMVVNTLHRSFRRHLRFKVRELGKLDYPIGDFESYIRAAVLPKYPNEPGLVGAFLGKARSTQAELLGAIEVPTAILHSVDDPVVLGIHMLQARKEAGENPWIRTRMLPRGGHVGMAYLDPRGVFGMLSSFFGQLRDG